jgi:hypothetical protein
MPHPIYPRKDPAPIVQETEWPPGLVWMSAESLASTRIRSQNIKINGTSVESMNYFNEVNSHLIFMI